MSKTGEIPYTWEEIEAEVKTAIRCQASILAMYGPCFKDCNLVMDFLGLPRELHEDPEFSLERLPEIDLSQHLLHHLAEYAYRYAYQLDGWWECPAEVWHEVDGVLQGYPQADAEGEPSPFCTLNDFPLRRMFETFFARYALFDWPSNSSDLTIRELSLLANMTVPAVRTSLSKEGFKLERVYEKNSSRPEEKAFKLKAEDAKLWLSRRRGFIPQRARPEGEAAQETAAQLLLDETVPFHTRLSQAVNLLGHDAGDFAAACGIESDWFLGLLSGKPVSPNVEALRAIARGLDTPEPSFAGSGVQHLLSLHDVGEAGQ